MKQFAANKAQRLNVESIKFNKWLIGLVDGVGFFEITKELKIFKIIMNKKNIKLMYKIKKHLKVGKICINKSKCIYSIKNIKNIKENIIPLFDKYILQTDKFFDFINFKKAIYSNDSYYQSLNIKHKPLPCLNKWWLIGYIEAVGKLDIIKTTTKEGHLYKINIKITAKESILLKNILKYLNIYHGITIQNNNNKSSMEYWIKIWNTPTALNIFKIIRMLNGNIKGYMSIEFKLWFRMLKIFDTTKLVHLFQKFKSL